MIVEGRFIVNSQTQHIFNSLIQVFFKKNSVKSDAKQSG